MEKGIKGDEQKVRQVTLGNSNVVLKICGI